jgi:hypothetical protein
MRILLRLVLVLPLLALTAGLGVGRAQFIGAVPQTAATGNPEVDRGSSGIGMEPSIARDMQQRQLKKLRELHQREMVTDTDRMIQLATAMKDEVDKGNKTLNADVLKDADEISKLAKRVSDRIKTQ